MYSLSVWNRHRSAISQLRPLLQLLQSHALVACHACAADVIVTRRCVLHRVLAYHLRVETVQSYVIRMMQQILSMLTFNSSDQGPLFFVVCWHIKCVCFLISWFYVCNTVVKLLRWNDRFLTCGHASPVRRTPQ